MAMNKQTVLFVFVLFSEFSLTKLDLQKKICFFFFDCLCVRHLFSNLLSTMLAETTELMSKRRKTRAKF